MSVFCQFSAPEVDWMRIACDIDVSFLAAAKGLPPATPAGACGRYGLLLRYVMSVFCQFSAPEVDWMRIACDMDMSFLVAATGLPPRNSRGLWEIWASSKICNECFLSIFNT